MKKLNVANINDISSIDEFGANDDYFKFSRSEVLRRPSDDFVISHSHSGNVISTYASDVWDLTPYDAYGGISQLKLIFSSLPHAAIQDAKWLVFLIMHHTNTGRIAGLSANTISGYMKSVRAIAFFAHAHEADFFTTLTDEAQLINLVGSLKSKGQLYMLSRIVSHLHKIGSKKSGVRVLRAIAIINIKRKLLQFNNSEQYSVIPPRILSEFVIELSCFIDDIHECQRQLNGFLELILHNKAYARSKSAQFNLGYNAFTYEPIFSEGAQAFGLNDLFNRYEIYNLPNLSLLINRTLDACRQMLHVYSGMRRSEVLNLKLGCLRSELNSNKTSFRIYGETSKHIGQRKAVSWVTSKEVVKAVTVAEMLSKTIGDYAGLELAAIPLFISTRYLGFSAPHKKDRNMIYVSTPQSKNQEVFQYFDKEKYKITKEDFLELEKIDPFRAWGASEKFKVGAIWRFTTHQFRRSLAFYVAQSALVSLPSLRRQLKHLSREMTMYYCKAAVSEESFGDEGHISKMVNAIKPEADAAAYINEVFFSQESLFGAHGKFVENRIRNQESLKTFTESRGALLVRFKKGELAYKTTPLGACISAAPCDKKATREIAACISCDKAVLKLSKLDNVIKRQTLFVEDCKAIDAHSVDFRSEAAELKLLTQFRDVILMRIKEKNG
ncbi:MAG: hypothetical protein BVN34_00945 [Proteobacteria bacterium ST_bin12]|nr:MAG: hypothetical protein BVN34_00945 [Proteobacteria bacterium ST_bin12]